MPSDFQKFMKKFQNIFMLKSGREREKEREKKKERKRKRKTKNWRNWRN